MKRAFLDAASPADVSHAVRDVLDRRGLLVSEHVSTHVRFRGVPSGDRRAWTRGGYVGIFQPMGDDEVEVRLVLRALWPGRILFTVAFLNVLMAVAVIATNPPIETWITAAFVGGTALTVAMILYLNTLRPVRDEERLLMEDFEAEWRRVLEGVRIEDQEEREMRLAELELEGELAERRVAKARKLAPPPPRAAKGRPKLKVPAVAGRFRLFPGKKQPPVQSATDEELEARRAALLARKAELEARRRGEQGP